MSIDRHKIKKSNKYSFTLFVIRQIDYRCMILMKNVCELHELLV